MSTNDKPRPETFEELEGYDTEPKQLASFVLEISAIGRGLLAGADQLVAALREVHGDDLIVTVEVNRVTVARPQSEAERAEVLERHQKQWDENRRLDVEAEQRKPLKVGDPIEVEASLRCRSIRKEFDCDLGYDHHGDHIEIVDGLVASRTKVGRR